MEVRLPAPQMVDVDAYIRHKRFHLVKEVCRNISIFTKVIEGFGVGLTFSDASVSANALTVAQAVTA